MLPILPGILCATLPARLGSGMCMVGDCSSIRAPYMLVTLRKAFSSCSGTDEMKYGWVIMTD